MSCTFLTARELYKRIKKRWSLCLACCGGAAEQEVPIGSSPATEERVVRDERPKEVIPQRPVESLEHATPFPDEVVPNVSAPQEALAVSQAIETPIPPSQEEMMEIEKRVEATQPSGGLFGEGLGRSGDESLLIVNKKVYNATKLAEGLLGVLSGGARSEEVEAIFKRHYIGTCA